MRKYKAAWSVVNCFPEWIYMNNHKTNYIQKNASHCIFPN